MTWSLPQYFKKPFLFFCFFIEALEVSYEKNFAFHNGNLC